MKFVRVEEAEPLVSTVPMTALVVIGGLAITVILATWAFNRWG